MSNGRFVEECVRRRIAERNSACVVRSMQCGLDTDVQVVVVRDDTFGCITIVREAFFPENAGTRDQVIREEIDGVLDDMDVTAIVDGVRYRKVPTTVWVRDEYHPEILGERDGGLIHGIDRDAGTIRLDSGVVMAIPKFRVQAYDVATGDRISIDDSVAPQVG